MVWKKPSKTKEPENQESAYDYAVFLLSLHLRTIREVLDKMKRRGYSENVISNVIEQLKSQRYLDDRRYAEIFLENLKAYRNFGFYGIKKKMMEKKLPINMIEDVLQEGFPLQEEIKIAERLLKKEGYKVKLSGDLGQAEGLHYSSFGDENQNKKKQKMSNRLKSRGFRSEVIAKVLF